MSMRVHSPGWAVPPLPPTLLPRHCATPVPRKNISCVKVDVAAGLGCNVNNVASCARICPKHIAQGVSGEVEGPGRSPSAVVCERAGSVEQHDWGRLAYRGGDRGALYRRRGWLRHGCGRGRGERRLVHSQGRGSSSSRRSSRRSISSSRRKARQGA